MNKNAKVIVIKYLKWITALLSIITLLYLLIKYFQILKLKGNYISIFLI